MKQCYHAIIKPTKGWYVGWVEEIPGALTHGRSVEECRQKLKDALTLVLETHRDESRRALDCNCIQETVWVDVDEPAYASQPA